MNLLIVNYHYYREERYQSGIYPTNKSALLNQVDEISKQGYRFTSVKELTEMNFARGGEIREKLCLITFDDGLKEQMSAYEVLWSLGIPSHFFVCSFPYTENDFIDVHKIHLLRTKIKDEELYGYLNEASKIEQYEFDFDKLSIQYRYDNLLSRKIKYYLNFVLKNGEKQKVLGEIFDEVFANWKENLSNYYFSREDLLTLDEQHLLGAHGHSHNPLATMTLNEATDDIEKNLGFLESVGCKNVNTFTYPYGGKSAVREDLEETMKSLGIIYAFTMNRDLNPSKANPLCLNRFDTNDVYGGKNFFKSSGSVLSNGRQI